MRVFPSLSVALAIAIVPSHASAGDKYVWLQTTTEEGCVKYDFSTPFYNTFNKKTYHINWSTPCRKGQLINGAGTLTKTYRDRGEVDDGWVRDKIVGTMVDGVFDGPVQSFGNNGIFDSDVDLFKMGCPYKKGGDDGQDHAYNSECVPRTRISHSTTSTTANAGSEGATPRSASPSVSSASVAARNKAAGLAANKGTVVPPLRPTITQEAHNPAGEATDCVRVIYKGDFEAEHVSTTQKAVFRNTCSHPVEVTWCTQTGDCKPGYTNLFTVPARKDRGFSYEPSVRGSKVAYAACYNGFVPHQGELSKKLNHACK